MNGNENQGSSYSIILLTIQNEKDYDKYRKKTASILKEAGGTIEREFDVMGQKGNIPDFETPNRLVVVNWNSADGHEKYMNHPDYKQAKVLLEKSVSNVRVVKGDSKMSQTSDSKESGRMYLMKISYYKENTNGRLEMLQELGSKLAPYGFYTERMIMAAESFGFDKPDEVTIHFHDYAAQNAELQKDKEVVSGIGKYNDQFLTQFVYLPLKLKG